jgi:ParB family chromosome partitioning protein
VTQDYQPVVPATVQVITSDKTSINIGQSPTEVSLDSIAPNPYQPRREFRPEELADLTQSILQQGIIQPLIVCSADGMSDKPYVLIAGERRLRAARQAGLKSVPCVVKSASKQQMLEWAIIENIQRADLNPVERAQAYREYMDRFNLTQADAAEKLGQPRTTVANYLRVLDLCDDVQKMLMDGTLTFGHAKVLAAAAGDVNRQVQLARKVVDGGLSVRQLEELMNGKATAVAATPAQPKIKPAHIRDLEERLTQASGTKVVIQPGRAKNTGRVVIEYYSLDDFDRIAVGLGAKLEG